MEPTLHPGDVVFVDPRSTITAGDVVCARHPHQPTLQIVKRVKFIDDHDQPYVISDNPDATDSADSRTFGPLPFDALVGRVTGRLRR